LYISNLFPIFIFVFTILLLRCRTLVFLTLRAFSIRFSIYNSRPWACCWLSLFAKRLLTQ